MRRFDVSNDRLGVLYGLSATEAEENLASLPQRRSHASRIQQRPSPEGPDGVDTGDSMLRPNGERKAVGEDGNAEERTTSTGKFRFKTSSSRARKVEESGSRHHRHRHTDHEACEEGSLRQNTLGDGGDARSEKRRKHRSSGDKHRHHRHHSSSRKDKVDYEAKGYSKPKRQLPDDPATYDDTYLPNAQSFKYTDPDSAFRESLFDAMADDEGAAFWEGVYGQRVDVYPRPEVEGPRGELEQLDDDEYAAYVRTKMYEKTHEYIFEERLKREKARIAAKERNKKEREEWEAAENERIRRDQARRQKPAKDKLKKRWEVYVAAWSQILAERKKDDSLTTTLIPWPVASGILKDVDRKQVEEFYLSAPVDSGEEGLLNLLKTERVKWHPDKMQQRWGQLETEIMAGINATFQTIDSIWVELKDKVPKTVSDNA